jgi:sugar phosphate isomerase/epimerase
MHRTTRRQFLRRSAAAAAILSASPLARSVSAAATEKPGSKMKIGLVTYLWGRDWDLPTLIANCAKTEVLGLELRTTHAHGVEPSLTAAERREVKRRFDDSPVTCVGPGSNERFCHPDPAGLKQAIEATKGFIRLSHDIGGSGVKVKPNSFHPGVPHEKTIEQIGRSLNELGRFADDWDQDIRLEVHGECSQLPTIKAIMDVADHPRVGVCWNSNDQDLQGAGLEANFQMVQDRLGATVHVRELNVGSYPYQQLIDLLVGIDYPGWVLLECRTNPADRIAALNEQRALFHEMVAKAQAG